MKVKCVESLLSDNTPIYILSICVCVCTCKGCGFPPLLCTVIYLVFLFLRNKKSNTWAYCSACMFIGMPVTSANIFTNLTFYACNVVTNCCCYYMVSGQDIITGWGGYMENVSPRQRKTSVNYAIYKSQFVVLKIQSSFKFDSQIRNIL